MDAVLARSTLSRGLRLPAVGSSEGEDIMLKLIALILSLWSPDGSIPQKSNPEASPAREVARTSTPPLAPRPTPPTAYQPTGDRGPCLDPDGRPFPCNPGA